MNRLLIIISVVLILCAFPVFAWESDVEFCFHNDSQSTVYYWLWWLDHDLKDYDGPFNLAGGELDKGEQKCIGYRYEHGIYVARWKNRTTGEYRRVILATKKKGNRIVLKYSEARSE